MAHAGRGSGPEDATLSWAQLILYDLSAVLPWDALRLLDGELVFGCPASCDTAARDGNLLFLYTSSSDGDYAVLQRVTELLGGSGADAAVARDVSAVAVQWLRFAHLGCLTECTPSWWVLVWAGWPCCSRLVDTLRCTEGLSTALSWLSASATNRSAFADRLRSVLEVDCQSAIVDRVLQWVAEMAADLLPWASSRCRNGVFAALGGWLRTGWKGCYARTQLGYLEGVHVTKRLLQMVAEAEQLLTCRFPADLRRALLEVGDFGQALFGWPILPVRPHSIFRGQWKWHDSSEKVLIGFGEQWDGPLSGSWVLGGGGGGYASQVVVVMEGPCWGQVWMIDAEPEATAWTLERWTSDILACGSDVMKLLLKSASMKPQQVCHSCVGAGVDAALMKF